MHIIILAQIGILICGKNYPNNASFLFCQIEHQFNANMGMLKHPHPHKELYMVVHSGNAEEIGQV